MFSLIYTYTYTRWSTILYPPDDYSTKNKQKYFQPLQSLTAITQLVYRTQFGVSINVCRLVGNILNITSNFLYSNHQVYKDFLITLYIVTQSAISLSCPSHAFFDTSTHTILYTKWLYILNQHKHYTVRYTCAFFRENALPVLKNQMPLWSCCL
jgi:hypothetical protein